VSHQVHVALSKNHKLDVFAFELLPGLPTLAFFCRRFYFSFADAKHAFSY
jgi:hypothetical protein